MNPIRLNPSLPLLAVCIGLTLAAPWVRARDADAASARTLDWNRAAPNAPGWSAPANPAATSIPLGDARPPERAQNKAATRPGTPVAAKGLFALDDRAIIIVGGKSTEAGTLKRALQAEIAAKAGAPKTVKGGARKLDLAALLGPGANGPKALPNRDLPGHMPSGGAKPTASTTTASPLQTAQVLRPGVTQSISGTKEAVSLAALRCPDKGPPKISESPGKLKAGASATVWGQCFGERPGRVEIIGQFPGGKLTLPFMAWDNNSIELTIPLTIRGAVDHVVAVTVVTADGKTSTAMQAQFVAARERVEVPDRLWAPTAGFDFAATSATRHLIDPEDVNEAHAGQVAKTLRVQPQCALDTMDAIVIAGGITEIRGWEQGPPNEASVTIDWVGTCVNTKTTKNYDYVVTEGSDVITRSACRVAFTARAWAYCPAGIAP